MGTLVFKSKGVVKLRMFSKVVQTEGSSQVEGFGLYFLHFGEDNLEFFEKLTSE